MTPRIEAGQIWADTDPRRAGRKLHINEIKANFVFATVVQNIDTVQQQIDTYGYGAAVDRRGTITRIGISRFYDGAYELCDPTDPQAPSVADNANIFRLPSACTDLAAHRWVPVTITYPIGSRPSFFQPAAPPACVVVAVCPRCWAHTEFHSPRILAPTTPGDIAA
ncbi:hypothetical protein [Streptomyces sp. NPDC004528]|uniref:hypothetical protein n=1 Tax=Streptomyces sp. NPDC004528 TaxID=3154550 RepID=UPI0033BDB66B